MAQFYVLLFIDQFASSSITSALENALLPPARDSVGAKILRKMGWRLGHGIGPKVTYEQHRRQLAQSSSKTTFEDATEDDDETKKHMYPSIDTKVPVYSRKDNSHGRGYQPGMGLTDMVSGKKDQSGSSGPNLSGKYLFSFIYLRTSHVIPCSGLWSGSS